MAPYWHYTLTVHISMEFSKGIYNTRPPIIVEVKNGSAPVVVTIQIQPFSTSRIMGVINNEAIHVPGCIFGGLEVHIPNHGISPPPPNILRGLSFLHEWHQGCRDGPKYHNSSASKQVWTRKEFLRAEP